MRNGVSRPTRQLTALALACVFPSLLTWVYFVVLSGRREAGVAYAVGKVAQFTFPVIWVRYVEKRRIRPRAPGRRGLTPALLFGALATALLLALYFGGIRRSDLLTGAADELHRKLAPVGLDTPLPFLALAGFYCVAHSLLEEYYWRWFVFGRLREWGHPGLAGAISSLGFMAHHVILVHRFVGDSWGAVAILSLCVAAAGAIWAWAYHRSGSLYGPWWSHGLVDAGLMVVGYDLLWGA